MKIATKLVAAALSLAALVVPMNASAGSTVVMKSMTLDPDVVVQGGTTEASIKVSNPFDRTLRPRTVIVFLGAVGSDVLATATIPQMPPHSAKTVVVDVPIPATAPTGAQTLRACRTMKHDPTTCAPRQERSLVEAQITVLGPAHLTISPTSKDYGNAAIQMPPDGPAQAFLITNDGGVPTGTITASITGAAHDQFDKRADSCNGNTLTTTGPGSSCTIVVAFEPTSLGTKNASLDVSATPGGSVSAPLTGEGGTAAHLTISQSSYFYGNVVVGGTPTKTFTVTNTGQQAATGVSEGLSGSSRYAAVAGSTCPSSSTINGGGSCTFIVRFSPVAGDATPPNNGYVTNLIFSSTNGGSPSSALSAIAVATPASITGRIENPSGIFTGYGSSPTVDIGNVQAGNPLTCGACSETFYAWIKNSGQADAPINPNPVAISRTNAVVTVFGSGTESTCDTNNQQNATAITFNKPFDGSTQFDEVVVPGSSSPLSECRNRMDVSPIAPGPFSVTFSVATSPGGTVTYTITGTGT